MKRPLAFLLGLDVVDDGAFARHELGHRVGKITFLLKAHVAFDDRRLASPAHHDEVAIMRNHRACASAGSSRRNKQQIDRLSKDRLSRNFDERPLLDEGGVQSHKGVVLVTGVARQVSFEPRRAARQGFGKAGDDDARRQRRS